MCQLVGHGFSMSRPCNSWCTADSFYYLLNTTQIHHFVNPKKKAPLHSFKKRQHVPSFHSEMEELTLQLLDML